MTLSRLEILVATGSALSSAKRPATMGQPSTEPVSTSLSHISSSISKTLPMNSSSSNNNNNNNFSRSLMSGSLPQLPTRISSPATNDPITTQSKRREAWGESNDPRSDSSERGATTSSSSSAAGGKLGSGAAAAAGSGSAAGKKLLQSSNSSATPIIDVPEETTLSVGLMRIADKLSRLVLPWQAVLCPRAVETLFDLRQTMIQTKHVAFINQMKQKLEEKVMGFIKKKKKKWRFG